MELGDWNRVQSLAAEQARVKQRLQDTAAIRAVAAGVYGFEGVLVDPFSPGLRALSGAPSPLPRLREEAVRKLARLEEADPIWQALYAARGEVLRAAPVEADPEAPAQGAGTAVQLRAEADRALAAGDFARLQKLSAQILEAQTREMVAGAGSSGGKASGGRVPDLSLAFPAEVLERAGRLGLVPVHVESMRDKVLELYGRAWMPTREGEASAGVVRLPEVLAADHPEALRERLVLFLNRPLVNSAGCRFLPWMVAEDALVEGFPEPAPGAAEDASPLLAALELPRRRGLSRNQLERALRQHGSRVLGDLGLDPHRFRVVCIPPDLHLRAGPGRDWGSQPQWTHFDGYMVQDRKFLALAGGDVRFGGINDLVAVNRDNDSPSLIARLAVVQRARLAAW
jgi:hypothetical protein